MDKSKLTPANENPWYILMTLYGEQDGVVDLSLAERNRRLWNAWICQGMSEEKSIEIAEKIGIEVEETAWTEEKEREVESLFAERMKGSKASLKIPDPTSLIRMYEVAFPNTVILWRTIFGATSFSGAHFGERIDFDGAHFGDLTRFERVRFGKRAYFDGACFSGTVTFQNATSDGLVSFKGKVDLSLGFLQHDLSSPPAHFGTETIFSEAHFKGRVDFYQRRFGPPEGTGKRSVIVTFANAIFEAPVSFEQAEFPHIMPVLSNTTLPQSTRVTAKDGHWPPIKVGWWPRGVEHEQNAADAKESAAALRHAVARQSLPDEEHFFFTREMHHTRRDARGAQWLLYQLFGAVSGYGGSIARPANALLALWLWPVVLFTEGAGMGLFRALGYSFANMFKFFGLHRTYFDFAAIRDWPAWVQWFSGAQTVLAFILLFFLGLGLRTRFRLR